MEPVEVEGTHHHINEGHDCIFATITITVMTWTDATYIWLLFDVSEGFDSAQLFVAFLPL